MRTSDAKSSTEYARHAKLRERAGGGVAAYIVAAAYIVVGTIQAAIYAATWAGIPRIKYSICKYSLT